MKSRVGFGKQGLGVLARFASVAALAFVSACTSGTETGNPSIVAKLSYQAFSSSPETVGVREPGSVGSVSAVWLVLGDVQFVPSGDCNAADDTGPIAPGLGVGDHAAGEPNTTEFTAEEGTYCAVALPLIKAEGPLPSGAPSGLSNGSIMIAGTLADGTPFSIESALAERFRLSAEAGRFDLTQAQSGSLIGFDVAKWLDGLDWAQATRTDGRIDVSTTTNTELLSRFESNLHAGIALYRDADGDGHLDATPVGLAH